jgi:membrane protein YqaA with SNARE-associated domain
MDNWIYLSLFTSCFLSATLIPFASELGLAAAIASGYDPVISVIVATIGNSLGGLTNYYLGKFGKFLWLKKSEATEKKQNKLKHYITKYGSLCALLSWVPIVGDPLLVMLGFMRVKLLPVAIYMVLGKFIRYIVIALFVYL